MAKGPGGKSAGRVSIRVVPDTTRFKADLKKSLDRIEKSTVVNIPLAIETRQAEIDLRKFAKKWNGQSLNFDVDAKTLGAATHLKEFTRTRTAPINIEITKKSVAKALTVLASLSGARVAGDLAKNLSNGLQNLDRSLPKIAAVILAIGAIGSVALSSVGGLATLAVSLSGILGLAGPLPGIIGAAGTGAILLGVALSDTKNQLSSLEPVWARLKSIIVDNFWDKARKPIIDFVRSTLPQLRNALPPVSAALGSWAASVAGGFKTAFAGGVLEGMLNKLRESIDIASTGTGGFASAIATLGTFGAKYLPRLAQWFADIANTFDAWLSKVASDGTLDKWAETGITVAKQLFAVLGSVLSIIDGVAKAATAAGGGGMATLVSVLAHIAEVVNSPAFQTTLATLFEGAAAGVSGLATALGPIGDMLSALAPTIASVLSSIGVTLGTVLGQIADTLATPEIAAAILSLFNGLRDGIQGILPALPSLGTLLASVAQFAGVLAGQLGEVLGQALITLVPLVVQLLTALEPIIPVLGQALVDALITLAPSFLQLVQAIVPILPQLATMAADLLPMLANTLTLVTPLIGFLLGVVSAVLQPFQFWMSAISSAQKVLNGLESSTQFVTAALNGKFGPVIQWLAQILPPLVSALRDGLGGAASFVGSAFERVSGVIRAAINGVISLVNGAIRSLNQLKISIPAWVPGIGGTTWGINLPQIPRLALGADVEPRKGGTAVVLGEGGRKETVTDFGKTNRLIAVTAAMAERSLAAGTSTTGGNTFNITEVSDPAGTSMAVIRRLESLGA